MTPVALVLFALLTRARNPSCRLSESTANCDVRKDHGHERLFLCGCFFSATSCQGGEKPAEMPWRRESSCTIIFTLEEINRDRELLPGVTLGYRIFNACGNQNLLSAAMAAVVGPKEQYKPGGDCPRSGVQALIGPSASGSSGIVSKTLAPLHLPQISHLSTCECLSNRNLYPAFFRTVPSDRFQIKALVELLKHFGWTWVGYIYGAETYAEEGTEEFIRTAKQEGICTEYMMQFFGTASEKTTFLKVTKEMNITGIQWVGSEACGSTKDVFLKVQLSDALGTFWEAAFGRCLSACSGHSTALSSPCCTSSHCPFLADISLEVCEMVQLPETTKPSQSSAYLCLSNSYIFLHQVPRLSGASKKSRPARQEKAANKREPVCFDYKDTWEHLQCSLEAQPEERFHQNVTFVGVLGLLLTTLSALGLCLTAAGALFFLQPSQNPPNVRAANTELSFLLLFSLTLCFLCSLAFVGRPSQWSCMLRHTVFGVTFVLCISCVLGKTIVVLMAFRATLPGSNVMKWFGPPQQRLSVVAFTLVQVLICVLWLTLSPPFPNKNTKYYKDKIILECDVGSAVGFWAVLGYIGVLSVTCFVLAFLARVVSGADVRFLSLSIFIYCATWTAFIQMYVRSLTKYTAIGEMLSVLS